MARSTYPTWSLPDSCDLIAFFVRSGVHRPELGKPADCVTHGVRRRHFHDYFTTHLPSSSLHPDSRSPKTGFSHKFPRSEATPHDTKQGATPAAHPHATISRETTVVRIPLRSAKHHFGAFNSRGSRPYNEDAYQAGVIELPAFAKKPPLSLNLNRKSGESSRDGEGTVADGLSGDPQVFYFGVFDGHGGSECSEFLKEQLHRYIEQTGEQFELESSLPRVSARATRHEEEEQSGRGVPGSETEATLKAGKKALDAIDTTQTQPGLERSGEAKSGDGSSSSNKKINPPYPGDPPLLQAANFVHIKELEKQLVKSWKDLVGGYFRRFKPAYFSLFGGYQALAEESESLQARNRLPTQLSPSPSAAIEEAVTYAFLKADLDFVSVQASRQDPDADEPPLHAPSPLLDNDHIVLSSSPDKPAPMRFKGGSTCSVALVSTPSPVPFWNPSTPSSMLIAHVGDTRVLICSTAHGTAIPLTTNHHPSSPIEGNRLRRYAATFVTDSFGEERMSGLANTRAFGDIASKRIGVSAEPEIKRVELGPAEYSFLVLVSDGVSGTLSDQEIVDIVKEAKTPEEASRNVVSFATEVSTEGDNTTCMVIRLGGWERRSEGGGGSLRTKESRDWKREEASDPRGRRR